ncbi:nucleoside phosphorylase domain-containing protein [Aspergillus californicus]
MPDHTHYTASQYTVGIICALDKELLAIRCLLDSVHPPLRVSRHDSNSYTLGTMGQHYVVASCLPASEYGTNSAASVASQMRISFPELEFCLLVGIAGGIPGKEDIRLGDVVVSLPTGTHSGVVQHDMGKAMPDACFIETGSLQRPPRVLLGAISSLRSNPYLTANPLRAYVDIISQLRPAYCFPGRENDLLFQPDCVHDISNATCDSHTQAPRAPRGADHPYIHYGLIGSGNKVVKDAVLRDQLGAKYNILCFEMEAAGILNVLPCLVIRGICDYSDSHKSKVWQEYAAATAAAYAKLLLTEVRAHHPVRDIAPVALKHISTEAGGVLEPPRGITLVLPGQPDRPPSVPERAGLSLERVIYSPNEVPSVQFTDTKRSQCLALQARRRLRSATDILQKARSYAERRGLWNEVLADTTSLVTALKDLAEGKGSGVLILEPQGPSAEPRADDFAVEIISLLKSQGQPIFWALSPAFDEPLTEHDIVSCIVEQLGAAHTPPNTTLDSQLLLSNILPKSLDDIGRLFFVLAIKHLSLASSLLKILEDIQDRPNRAVKIMMVSYSAEYSHVVGMLPSARVHQVRPAPPNLKRKRTQTRWRETVRFQI